MLIPVPPSECMRAREAVSGRLDGELSEIEAVRLDAHLRSCAACAEFAEQAVAFTSELRGAPLEQPAMLTFEPSRRHVHAARMHGSVAAAMVVLVAGSITLGTLYPGTSTQSRGPVAFRSISGSVALLRRDSVEQRLFAMLPAADRWRAELQGLQTPAL